METVMRFLYVLIALAFALPEDAKGRPVYDWTIIDRIFDTYMARGVRPYVEIGFMPEALSTRPEPYQHEWRPGLDNLKTGWAYPPRDYGKWEELVYQWTKHCIARYGRANVASWYFETWNEANLGNIYWGGTRDEFFRLHDTTVKAIRRALPEARIGGPDIAGAGDDFLPAFMAHEEAAGVRDDFVSFHAKGAPSVVDGPGGKFVRMGIATQLQVADKEFSHIQADAQFRDKPIIIGESDPEGCAACQGPTNAYRNGAMYASYEAAVFPRLEALAGRRNLDLEGELTWAFEFEDQRYFPGFRQLASNGLPLPVLNVFRMFALMTGEHIAATSDHQAALDDMLAKGVRGEPDVGTAATRDGDRISILVWHYHDDDVAGPAADVTLDLSGLPSGWQKVSVTHYRVDADHSNAYTAWLAVGSPLAPNPQQYQVLTAASDLATLAPAHAETLSGGRMTTTFTLPRQGVSLIVIDKTQ